MDIYVPSLSRANKIAESHRTVGHLCRVPTLVPRIHVVAPEDQYDDYVASLDPLGVDVLSCPVNGIDKVRHWIGMRAQAMGQSTFCMMDDDLTFARRITPGDWHARQSTAEDIREMIEKVEQLLMQGYAAVGVSAREGNNRLTGDVKENTRMIRVLSFHTKTFLECEHGRVPVMEDFDVLLQLLRKGLPNVVTVNFLQGQRATQETGGCSDYRTLKNHSAAAEKLAELHKGFVSLRIKKNKGDFGVRKEVTIQWKKAFDSAGK